MKRLNLFVAAMAMAFVCSVAVKAADEKKEAPAASEWTGSVACAHCNYAEATKAKECAAAIKVGDKVLYLKASDKADDATKEKIKNYKKELKGEFTVKGTTSEADGKTWVVADSIAAAAAKPK